MQINQRNNPTKHIESSLKPVSATNNELETSDGDLYRFIQTQCNSVIAYSVGNSKSLVDVIIIEDPQEIVPTSGVSSIIDTVKSLAGTVSSAIEDGFTFIGRVIVESGDTKVTVEISLDTKKK